MYSKELGAESERGFAEATVHNAILEVFDAIVRSAKIFWDHYETLLMENTADAIIVHLGHVDYSVFNTA